MDQDPMVVGPANGVTNGDEHSIPNRGTSSGMVGMGAPYGASIDVNATNSMGSIHGSCGSDPAEECYPPGEVNRFSSSGHSSSGGGVRMGGTGSDPEEDEAKGQGDDEND